MKYVLVLLDLEDGTSDVGVCPLTEHNVQVLNGNINWKFVFDADSDEHAKEIGPGVLDKILEEMRN